MMLETVRQQMSIGPKGFDCELTSAPTGRTGESTARSGGNLMAKVGLTVLSAALLLLCSGCANSGIRYGSTIELDAGSDLSNERRAGAGMFFGGNFGRIQLGR
jgi:hypothetical protein